MNQRIIAGLPLAGGAINVHLRKQGPQPAGISAQARLEVGSFEAMSDGGVSSHWTQYIDLIIGGITKIFQGCTTLVIHN